MREIRFQQCGTPEQIEEFCAASAPTEPPTLEQLSRLFESMRAAGWDRPTS